MNLGISIKLIVEQFMGCGDPGTVHRAKANRDTSFQVGEEIVKDAGKKP